MERRYPITSPVVRRTAAVPSPTETPPIVTESDPSAIPAAIPSARVSRSVSTRRRSR